MKISELALSAINIVAKPFMGSNIGYRFPFLIKMYYGALKMIGIEPVKKVHLSNGIDLYVDTKSFIGVELLAKKSLETETVALFDSLLDTQSVIVDAGANIGCYTTYFGKNFGQKTCVFAIEPDEHNLVLLKKNLELNAIENVVLIPGALGDKNGFVELETSSDHGHTQINEVSNGRCPLLTLDTIVEQHKIARIDLLKIDIEGAELAALKGAVRTIKSRKIQNIYIEINPGTLAKYGVSARDVIEYIEHDFVLSTVDGEMVNSIEIENMVRNKAYIDVVGRLKAI